MKHLKLASYSWKIKLGLWLFVVISANLVYAADWQVDASKAKISFKTKGMVQIDGVFPEFESKVQGDLFKPENFQIDVTIQTDRVSTGKSVSDEIVKGTSFFNVKKYPFATFSSSHVRLLDAQNSVVRGNLTLVGKTKSIEFKVNLGQPQINRKTRVTTINASADIPINRTEWGMNGFRGLVDPVVSIHIDVPFISNLNDSADMK